jgi:hypothetical protein
MMKAHALVALALAAAACTPPTTETAEVAAPVVPPEIAAVVNVASPGVTVTGGALDTDDNEYEVSGKTAGGEDIEFDLRQSNGVWTITQIQRDVAWATAPEAVRAVYAASPNPFEPVRVIESTDPVDGAIYYQLFSPTDEHGHPSVWVRWYEGEAAVMPPAH